MPRAHRVPLDPRMFKQVVHPYPLLGVGREQTLDQIRLQKKSCNVQCHGQSELWEITSAAPLILLVCNTRPLITIILAVSQFSGGYWLDVFRTSTYVDEPPLTMTPRCLACWTAALMRLF